MSYIELYKQGKLEEIRDTLIENLKTCTLCPRNCRVNRLEGEVGFCNTKRLGRVSSYFLHFGEEKELVGRGGSGTIFFSYCNLGCLYCQNYTISHFGEGREVSAEELAKMMLILQKQGAENINFVTPTHVITSIIEGLCIAVGKGLTLPLVYNCGGYEKVETLKLIEGVFDIYMPDIKYSDSNIAAQFSFASNYWQVAKEAIKEMHRQVGDLVVEKGKAKRGLLIRHLVLPNRLAGSFKILDFVREDISLHTYVNIMQQYYPCYRAYEFKELRRKVTFDEYLEVIEYARERGLSRGVSFRYNV
jgi:putative pyruvate formate lyase activating enzyme